MALIGPETFVPYKMHLWKPMTYFSISFVEGLIMTQIQPNLLDQVFDIFCLTDPVWPGLIHSLSKGSHPEKKAASFRTLSKRGGGSPTRIQKFWGIFF